MPESDAERKRRSRAHLRGDHSACRAERCDLAGQPPALLPEDVPAPAGYVPERGVRGAALWAELADLLPPAQRLMLDEACRLADRLDRLEFVLSERRSWLSTETDDGGRVIVVVDAALAEARQGASALKGLLVEVAKALPKAPPAASPRKGGAGLADLVALADRRRSSAG